MRHEPDYLPVTVSTGVDYLGWSAIQLKRGQLSLFLVPEIGGRIMGIQYCGQDLSFVQPERAGQAPLMPERFELEQWRDNLKFPLWGGGKTWIAPESAFPGGAPYPDLDSGPYKFEIVSQNTERVEVVMTSGICRDTRLRIKRTISMDFLEPSWVVEHEVVNCGDKDWTGGLWDALMLRRPGVVYFPAHVDGVSIYQDKGDADAAKQVFCQSDLLETCIQVNCYDKPGFKVGVQMCNHWIAARLRDDIGYLRRFEVFKGKAYSHGSPGEVYNSARYPYFSIEGHSHEVTLAPEQDFSFKVMEQVGPWEKYARKIQTGRVSYEFN